MGTYKHGGMKEPLYSVWKCMKARCYKRNGKDYDRYGARGITVCAEWKTDYRAFADWASANGYIPHETMLDRINNDGGRQLSIRFIQGKFEQH